ncbi:MAG: alpha-L-glutamate ligase-like protein [Pseudomonadota bacterium]|nr:alpha-L-glutamate ligase-like protein [Pseudomonadota bacterium]
MLGPLSLLRRSKILARAGVLGINRRNADYTLIYNDRKHYPLVDDKYQTKLLARTAGIEVPELYEMVETERQTCCIHDKLTSRTDFVVKPARGSGGDGIIVITGRRKQTYRKISGQLLSHEQLTHHLSNILSGMYSLGGHPDKALIEYRVRFDPIFNDISYLGVPDIRIIVFLGVPVMAMVRLPTQMSDGKANLHQGAIGVGVSIASGRTTYAVWHNTTITEHPDTGAEVNGIQLPRWDHLLEIAARCYELTGLGYLGVDIVLDRDLGPLMLELNARPGLNIQIANRQGLNLRLEQVKKVSPGLPQPAQRIQYAREHFI